MDLMEQTSIRRFLLVFAVTAFALTVLPAGVEATGPALMRLVDGNSDARAQVDDGRVRVGDGSGALTVNGAVLAQPPRVRHGYRVIDFDVSDFNPRSFDLPENVVLTDVLVTRNSQLSEDTPCDVYLREVRDGASRAIHRLRPSTTDSTVELHFESGIAPTADRLGFYVNSDCRIEILWSGFTAP